MPHLPFVPPERQPKAPQEPKKPRPVSHGHLAHQSGAGYHGQRTNKSGDRRAAIQSDQAAG